MAHQTVTLARSPLAGPTRTHVASLDCACMDCVLDMITIDLVSEMERDERAEYANVLAHLCYLDWQMARRSSRLAPAVPTLRITSRRMHGSI